MNGYFYRLCESLFRQLPSIRDPKSESLDDV
jgi:hypothetical protein